MPTITTVGWLGLLSDNFSRYNPPWKNYLYISILPKVSVSELMGTLKGKLVIKILKSYPVLKKPYWGNHFGRGDILRVQLDWIDVIRRYVKYKENEERKEKKIKVVTGLFEST